MPGKKGKTRDKGVASNDEEGIGSTYESTVDLLQISISRQQQLLID